MSAAASFCLPVHMEFRIKRKAVSSCLPPRSSVPASLNLPHQMSSSIRQRGLDAAVKCQICRLRLPTSCSEAVRGADTYKRGKRLAASPPPTPSPSSKAANTVEFPVVESQPPSHCPSACYCSSSEGRRSCPRPDQKHTAATEHV